MISIYQNSNADNYESIKSGFIVRTVEYSAIISTLKNRKSGDSIQHELILGRRGSGKSTLLKRIEVEIVENKKLNTNYIPVNLAEEQAGIFRLMDLWEQVLQGLCCHYEEKLESANFSDFPDEQTYTRYLYGEIHRFCTAKKKKAVLLLDNFDRIVGNFSDDGNLLRETLINYCDLVLIAASARMNEHFWKYDQPFYEFFRRHRLEALNSGEAFLLLIHWSNALDFDEKERTKIRDFLKKYPGKVENIRLLTDGMPRTMFFFLKLVLQTEKPVETDFLKRVMDEATPLYQERLLNQTPPMRKIILEMAFMWEAAATKEIAEQCRMESKAVAAILNTLTDRNIVETIATDKRNNLYRLAERFFNMWLIVTQGNPDQKRKARWMSEFLENWYDKLELQTIARQYDEIIDDTKSELREPPSHYGRLPKTVNENENMANNCIEKGDDQQMFNLALMYYEQNKNREQIKQYIGRYNGSDIGIIIIEIWAGIFHSTEERAIAVCREERESSWFIKNLLILHQKSLVDKLFHHAEFGKRLRAQYTVLYYISQILNGKKKENNLLLRIPPELQTTVENVFRKIKYEQERYSNL